MKQLSLFFKKLRIQQILMTVFVGFMLLLGTACSSETAQGARPDNLPVQMGGNNNPHTRGGDGYTDYKMSTDPKVKANPKKQANLQGATDRLIADGSIKSNASDLIYPGSDLSNTSSPDIGTVQQKSLPDLPNQKQPMLDRSNPDSKAFERAGEAFKDASDFLKDTAEGSQERPEAKANPAIDE